MRLNILIAACLLLCCIACGPSKNATTGASKPVSQSGQNGQKYAFLDEQTFLLSAIADDDSYGYEQKNPIKVGNPGADSPSAANERFFLNALLGPNGEKISYNRQGSCCSFKTPNGFMGGGLLDVYDVTYPGYEKTIRLYINMYDPGELIAPKGFTYKK